MLLCDVNVLVYAYREDVDRHADYRAWLDEAVNGDEVFGVSDHVLSGFLRVVTHPRIFSAPSKVDAALEFCAALRSAPRAVLVAPGQRHWPVFARLCQQAGAKGNLIPDAYFAATAIEWGADWITTDRDYARFPGLRWRHPLDMPSDSAAHRR
jgi:toxin-antitoxin system PIN domain toxin